MEEFHIVFASDEKFSLQLRVAVGSLIVACFSERCLARPVIHILDCGLDDRTWKSFYDESIALARRYGDECLIFRHRITMEAFKHLPVWHSSRAAYARLLLPDLLSTVGKCVYADCDVLFFDNPVDILHQIESQGVAIIGHYNPPDESGTSMDWRWFDKVHEPYNADTYFCSGLIGMDLEKFRRSGAMENTLSFLAKHVDAVSADQCALNWFFRDDSAVFENGWGVWPDEVYSWSGPIGAIHYVGGRPWKDFSWYEYVMDRELDNIWRDFCRRYTREGCYWQSASRKGVCVGRIVKSIAALLQFLNLECPCRPHFMSAYRQRELGKRKIKELHESLMAGFDGAPFPEKEDQKLD